MYNENYAVATDKCLEVPRRTLTQQLEEEKSRLQSRLDEIEAVLVALKQNPQIQSVLDFLQKTRCI